MTQIQRSSNCASLLLPLLVLLSNGVSTATTAELKLPPNKQDLNPKCLLPLEVGPCRMSLERYYYNAQTNSCETFKFGGCRGNDNRFGFRKTCEDTCLRPATVAAAPADAITTTKSSIAGGNSAMPKVALPTVRAVAATTESPKKVLVTGK